jgi:hypothetical protein
MKITEPTSEQCSHRDEVEIPWGDKTTKAYACWYPQMGGYGARCLVVPLDSGGCFDAYVWHDGEFPFSEVGTDPAVLHHCDPAQFVEFGQWAATLPGILQAHSP